jgi:hypothetical protein
VKNEEYDGHHYGTTFGSFLKKCNAMDNPRKKKADGKRVSRQTHEEEYQKRRVSKKNSSNEEGRSDSNMRSRPDSGAERSRGR